MELTDKQIKDLVARRHPEYEKKKNIGIFSPALTLAGEPGSAKISFVTSKRVIRSSRSALSERIALTTLAKW